MIILKKHFNNQDTAIYANVVSNGCQTFYAEKLDEVCQEFEVPENIKQDVIRALAENQGVDDNMDEITRFEKLQQFNNKILMNLH